jgi:putative phosphoserine phosphatase/1-acylglycerol-3-phosphate O-acyltransferase
VVSSATRFQIEPLARDLGIEHVLCTQVEVRDGILTGKVLQPTCYGEGKALAARELAIRYGIDFDESYFYTDSHEDLPLLEIVGHPRPTNPSRKLMGIARERGWPVRRFTSRGTPGLEEVLRTGLAVGSVVPSFLFGLPVGLLNRTRRQALNLAMAALGELAPALAGISLRVEGEEHLWSQRPAVFIFNHQSRIDPLLICKLVHRDVVGITGPHARWDPICGLLLAFGAAVYVPGFHRESPDPPAGEAMQALGWGLSIAIAPEGRRSPSPRLGRFGQAAFRLAMAGGVPIVPIVFRNTLDALPKGAVVIRPAEVEVVVHPPIPTEHWTVDGLPHEIEEIRHIYVETLSA